MFEVVNGLLYNLVVLPTVIRHDIAQTSKHENFIILCNSNFQALIFHQIQRVVSTDGLDLLLYLPVPDPFLVILEFNLQVDLQTSQDFAMSFFWFDVARPMEFGVSVCRALHVLKSSANVIAHAFLATCGG